MTLPYTGTYILAVAGTGSASGPVGLPVRAVRQRRPDFHADPGHRGHRGRSTNPGDQASYTFTGSSGQNLFFDGLSASSGIDAELLNPSGGAIFNNVAANGDTGPYTLSEPGTYTLTISGSNGSTGNYAFNLLDTSAATLVPTSTPATISGTIMPGTGTNIYQIMGTAGEQLTLNSDSFSSTSGTWYLVDPNNHTVASAGFGSSFSATLALSGPYALIVQGNDTTDSGVSYSFDISSTTPAAVIPNGFGTEQSGSLGNGDSMTFTFTASAGLSIYFNSLGFNVSMDANFTDPNGHTVFDYDPYTGNAGPYVLTASGTYTLTLTNNSGSSGTYDFNMLDMTDSAARR